MAKRFVTEQGYRWMSVTRDGRLTVPEDDYGHQCTVLGFPFESRQDAIHALEDFIKREETSSGSYVLVEQFAIVPTWD